MKVGDIIVTTQKIGGWARPETPSGMTGVVTGLYPLTARFGDRGRFWETQLYPGEYM